MIDAVFLCDTKWKISRIRECSEKLQLCQGDILTDLILEKEELQNNPENHYSLELTFFTQKAAIPAIIDSFKEGSLVVLAKPKDNQDFIDFNNRYQQYLDWAKNHLMGLYHNEYYLIQQMNNQLIDAKRRLTRSNRQLEYALKENKEINEKLDEARIFAEQANLSKTRFLANMSHDIRTPMNAIVGLAELMQHHLLEPELLKNYIAKLLSSSHYLLDLINDILDLSKIENGSMELNMEPMDLGAQVEQVITIIRPQIVKKKQELSVHSDCNEFGLLMGDPVRFRQVLMNLFSNAVKYTPEGGTIGLTIHETQRSAWGRSYQFVIADSGIGMTPEFMAHIFDPFARAETQVKEIQGTGLGMAITKNIIDAMGGTIRVNSTLGKGSQFCVELSFENCASEDMKEQTSDGQTNVEQTNQEVNAQTDEQIKNAPVSLKGMRFLCAEDNELNAEILTSMLELEGATCTVYGNGKQIADAFESVKPGEYDAILMDVQMPVMDGYEATKQIRNSKNPLGKTILIIAMTANAFSEDVQRCLDAGMNAHVAKPVDFDKLKEIMGNR